MNYFCVIIKKIDEKRIYTKYSKIEIFMFNIKAVHSSNASKDGDL